MTSPVRIEFRVEGFDLAPAAERRDGTGHLHWSSDGCETGTGLENGAGTISVPLEPGDHTICVEAYSADHEKLGARDEITIHVTGPSPGTGSEKAQHWEGTIDGDIKSGPDCIAAKNAGEFAFDVDADGKVSGEGSVTSTEYTCTTPQGTSTIP